MAIEAKKVCYRDMFRTIKKPRYDVETRWNSTFLMVKDFCDNQTDYKNLQIGALTLRPLVWIFIEEYAQAFKPVHDAMLQFQRADIPMSK